MGLVNNRHFPVGLGSLDIPIPSSFDTVYNEFSVPIRYLTEDIPDTISIDFELSGEVGSVVYIDDISLSYIQLIRPEKDDVIIAGENDTIEWDADSENIEIMYSLDDGNSYTTIESKYPADSARYIWDVPDDLLSAKAKIRIEDSDDNTIFDEIPVYIKPWQLTRFDKAGDFELFKPDEDGWQIQNDSSSMWPQEWWQQFNYLRN